MTIATQATGRQWIVASQSSTDTFYIVKRTDRGYSCDCPDFFHRCAGRNIECKHIGAVKSAQPSILSDEARAWGLAQLTGKRA